MLEQDWSFWGPPGAHFHLPAHKSWSNKFCPHGPLQKAFLCLQYQPEQEGVQASLCPTQSGIAWLFSLMASGRAHSPCQGNVGCLLNWLVLLRWWCESQF